MGFLKSVWKDESGMGIIEIAIIIVIVIAVALIFKQQIEDLMVVIFEKIDLSLKEM